MSGRQRRRIIHLDMDAFYAAIEQLDNPAYRGKPVIVGGLPHERGVVSTCSYEARKYGIRSAMPLREAARRCPHGIFVPGRMQRYREVSAAIMKLLREYTPLVEPLSCDEAFLDVTGSEPLFGPAETIARQIVDRIAAELQLSASVGVAPNKFLAKLASDLKKPRGFVVIEEEDVLSFLAPLPINRIWGVGPKTTTQLQKMGLKTIGDLQELSLTYLRENLGDLGINLYRLARGIDDRPVETDMDIKSIGHETTFQEDTADREFLEETLWYLSEKVARRLRRKGLVGKVITIKLRDHDFQTITRQTTLYQATDFEEVIYQTARQLAEANAWSGKPLRLIGVSVSGLQTRENSQAPLFTESADTDLRALHQTLDRIRERFGENAITRARFLK
ncbi:DNA polymerase IV [Capillibacterium thermochitinicola]|uniref:DNA polymerase IV n=1 Tax=Capillibacterium thermochitinicola TaxID=2699427 RepID=A0A8J6I1C0_9FIRM|nr:DNA polymerase IV [Capillibacterium thermochitinicola]MBA2133860.1 DNA polymerase IV [Capillibacterium thermochitinicola]